MLAIAKSRRASARYEFINWEVREEGGHAQALCVAKDEGTTIQAQVDFDVASPALRGRRGDNGDIRKALRINGIQQSRQEDFVGHVKVAAFSAEDTAIVSGPPDARRRFLDIFISQTDRQYLKSIQRYRSVLSQRNKVLRGIRDTIYGRDLLDFWDERLAYEGATIISARRDAISALREHSSHIHGKLTDNQNLEIAYAPRISFKIGGEKDFADLTDEEIIAVIRKNLTSSFEREVAQGTTLVGPHRDDISMHLNGKSISTYASRGQARIATLSLKLAEAAVTKATTGTSPIIALDDVLSELDEKRRVLVSEVLQDYEQVLITTADMDLLPSGFTRNAQIFAIKDAKITRQ